jgi:hypothetical protein
MNPRRLILTRVMVGTLGVSGLLFVQCGSAQPSTFSSGLDSGGGNDGAKDSATASEGGTEVSGEAGGILHLASPDAMASASETGTTSTVGGPTTCAEAAASQSYIGCDYWPTVTANSVWSIFDYTVIVANTQSTTADITVTGPGAVNVTTTVAPNDLTKIYLPWVPALKGGDSDACGDSPSLTRSVFAAASAYHLTASVPVTVYQFNALEYQGMGGPPGKNWATCPGNEPCADPESLNYGTTSGCFSFTNDASLLLPSTAMTGNYRVTAEHGSTNAAMAGYVVVTATQDNTTVTVGLSANGNVQASADGVIAAVAGGTSMSLTMNAGDVAEILGGATDTADLSGSLVHANNPVQVLSGVQCTDEPITSGNTPVASACDHLESSVLPAETLGKDYVVTVPTSPHGAVIGSIVRFYGNVDGTTLTYSPSQPLGCPSTLNAGQVVECTGTASCPYVGPEVVGDQIVGVKVTANCVTQSFEVTGTSEFAVSTFQLGGSIVDLTGKGEGDPSMSPMVTTEQYRTRYIFLAPTDYDESYVDVVAPPDATLTLDGTTVTTAPVAVNGNWSVTRIALGAGQNGAHVLTGTEAFGVQVIGYGLYTSYQYPAGLDLQQISVAPPPPPPPK